MLKMCEHFWCRSISCNFDGMITMCLGIYKFWSIYYTYLRNYQLYSFSILEHRVAKTWFQYKISQYVSGNDEAKYLIHTKTFRLLNLSRCYLENYRQFPQWFTCVIVPLKFTIFQCWPSYLRSNVYSKLASFDCWIKFVFESK
jgi:hypothetical protein